MNERWINVLLVVKTVMAEKYEAVLTALQYKELHDDKCNNTKYA